jgi:hypothetical protein
MKRREDIYNLGNDYFQKTDVYFVTADEEAAKSADIAGYKAYSDGLFHFTTQPVYELSGGVSALNKRIFNVPQGDWKPLEGLEASAWSAINDASAVLSPDYATGIVVDLNGGDTTKSDWSNTPGGKN